MRDHQTFIADWNSGMRVEELANKYGHSTSESVYAKAWYLRKKGFQLNSRSVIDFGKEYSSLIFDWNAGTDVSEMVKKYGYKSSRVLYIVICRLRRKGISLVNRVVTYRKKLDVSYYSLEYAGLIASFKLGKTGSDISREMGISRERVRQIKNKCVEFGLL